MCGRHLSEPRCNTRGRALLSKPAAPAKEQPKSRHKARHLVGHVATRLQGWNTDGREEEQGSEREESTACEMEAAAEFTLVGGSLGTLPHASSVLRSESRAELETGHGNEGTDWLACCQTRSPTVSFPRYSSLYSTRSLSLSTPRTPRPPRSDSSLSLSPPALYFSSLAPLVRHKIKRAPVEPLRSSISRPGDATSTDSQQHCQYTLRTHSGRVVLSRELSRDGLFYSINGSLD